ncbi:MAG: glycosyltransferase family 2 protein, partial [Methanomassiliicoccaceae archaeon]|nr:glycosyltransferase family 2 protein [Methanomassiliicoccaceae archaeon]
MLSVSVCVCAYNEEDNIERAIRSVFSQNITNFKIIEVIVVSSGSTDGTDDIVAGLMNEFPLLDIIRQKTRAGKNFAINEFLDKKTGDVSVLLNGDNILCSDDSLCHLISPFDDENVGMAGGHPIPTNDPKDLIGFASHMIWTMHHHVSMMVPKIGELVAFRDIGTRLSTELQSDEDQLRMMLEKKGYISVYAKDAVVMNRGPETVDDFIKQRTRVNIGEEYMRTKFGYAVSTWNKKLLLRALVGAVRDLGLHPVKMSYAIMLESKARRKAKAHVAADK